MLKNANILQLIRELSSYIFTQIYCYNLPILQLSLLRSTIQLVIFIDIHALLHKKYFNVLIFNAYQSISRSSVSV